jgi:hypothetical protein
MEASEQRPNGTVTNDGTMGVPWFNWHYSDATEHAVNLFFNLDSGISGFTDLHEVDHTMASSSGGVLTDYWRPDGEATHYTYAGYYPPAPGATYPDGPFMTSVTTSAGDDASFTYDSQWRVHTLTIASTGQPDDTTTFDYVAPDGECPSGTANKTVVTYSDGDHAYYCADSEFDVIASDDDVIPDLGDGDDGSCTAPADEPLDCGEGDITPEEADPDEFQARSIATSGFGIADDTHLSEFNMFDGSALFDALPITRVRHIVPWDLAYYPAELDDAAHWVKRAIADGNTVLLSFEKCRAPEHTTAYCVSHGAAPSLHDYSEAINAFFAAADSALAGSDRAALKEVHLFTAWNEPNLDAGNSKTAGQPVAYVYKGSGALTMTNSGAYLAGRYWRNLSAKCRDRTPRCSVIAGDFSDGEVTNPGANKGYGKAYLAQYRAGLHRTPLAWAWHAYDDTKERIVPHTATGNTANDAARRWKRFKAFEKATRLAGGDSPSIYITEVGVIRYADHKVLDDTTNAMKCLLGELPYLSDRIKRFYYYQFRGTAHLDTGLVNRNDPTTKNPDAYDVFLAASSGTRQTCPVPVAG